MWVVVVSRLYVLLFIMCACAYMYVQCVFIFYVCVEVCVQQDNVRGTYYLCLLQDHVYLFFVTSLCMHNVYLFSMYVFLYAYCKTMCVQRICAAEQSGDASGDHAGGSSNSDHGAGAETSTAPATTSPLQPQTQPNQQPSHTQYPPTAMSTTSGPAATSTRQPQPADEPEKKKKRMPSFKGLKNMFKKSWVGLWKLRREMYYRLDGWAIFFFFLLACVYICLGPLSFSSLFLLFLDVRWAVSQIFFINLLKQAGFLPTSLVPRILSQLTLYV